MLLTNLFNNVINFLTSFTPGSKFNLWTCDILAVYKENHLIHLIAICCLRCCKVWHPSVSGNSLPWPAEHTFPVLPDYSRGWLSGVVLYRMWQRGCPTVYKGYQGDQLREMPKSSRIQAVHLQRGEMRELSTGNVLDQSVFFFLVIFNRSRVKKCRQISTLSLTFQ